jgi:AcrR family transcriptional regulator
MAKAFSEQEREIIAEKLIAACEECWNLYGYQKTSIRDLCSRCGISPGAFYLFYKSKELLFVETAERAIKRISSIIDKNMPPEKPAKKDYIKAFKIMAKEIEHTKWLVSLNDDIAIFQRKLPQNKLKDFVNTYTFRVEKHKFRPKISYDITRLVLGVLLALRINPNIASKNYSKAYEFIVDSVIDRLFE